MGRKPAFSSQTKDDVAFLIDTQALLHGSDVVIQSDQVDTANTGQTNYMRPGNVIAKRTSTGEFVLATDTNADQLVAATITSSGHSDGNGVIAIAGNHPLISVTTTTGTGTEANNATDLNADADFAAHYIATSGGGELTITAKDPYADFYIDSTTMATASFSEGIANKVQPTVPDIRVLWGDVVDMNDETGTATDAVGQTILAGHFDESALLNNTLTPTAKYVLERRGSIFG